MSTLDAKFPLNSRSGRDKEEYYSHIDKILHSSAFARTFKKQAKGKTFHDLDVPELAALIDSMYKEGTHRARKDEYKEEVAPAELIIADFASFWREEMVHVDPEYKLDLSVRAIQGHAQMGHCVFNPDASNSQKFTALRQAYPNTSNYHILSAIKDAKSVKKKIAIFNKDNQLPRNPAKFAPRYMGRRTDKNIDNFVTIIDDLFENPLAYVEDTYLYANGNPLFGLEFLRDQPVNLLEIVRSLYFSLHMDADARKTVQKKYGLNMGLGTHHIVNQKLFAEYGLNLQGIAKCRYTGELKLLEELTHEKRMDVLQELGITEDIEITESEINTMRKDPCFSWKLLKEKFGVQRFEDTSDKSVLTNVYFRDQQGLGISDDLAILQAGFIPHTFRTRDYRQTGTEHVSRIIGAFIGDHIDTIHTDASHIFTGGQDGLLLHYLTAKWKNALANPEFIDAMKINRSARDLHLISDRVLTDFIALGANYAHGKKGDYDVIHSSQRWFFRKSDDTSAIGEYMKLSRDGMEEYGLTNQKPFVQTPEGPTRPDIKVTFEHIHFGPIENEYYERTKILTNPKTTSKDIKTYISKRTEPPVVKRHNN